ncbi:universal stress protein [Archangium sp.]|uniref:universal stress protein n=1 Tax=Archangium sp. TaxID=1872627 RepID=UPI00286C593A|nr:universal stress protein [Archangium sp.]
MIKHILVAIDGSDSSRKAARFAHDLAQQTNARITLLFVLEPPRMIALGFLDSELISGSQRSPEELEAVRRLLDEVASDLPKAQVDKVVEIGRPADTIVAQADALGADHIVIGARGLNPGGKWLLGSVSDRVVQHAGRPVTVVH